MVNHHFYRLYMDHLTIRKWLVTGVSELYHLSLGQISRIGNESEKTRVIILRGRWDDPLSCVAGKSLENSLMEWENPPWRSSWRISIAMTRGCPGKNQNINA